MTALAAANVTGSTSSFSTLSSPLVNARPIALNGETISLTMT